MADYSVVWSLSVDAGTTWERLPLISTEIAEDLINSGGFDEQSCPNSFFSRKGMEPAKGTVVVPYSWVTANLDFTNANPEIKLRIEFEKLNPEVELPDADIQIDLLVGGVTELYNHSDRIVDDDLCLVSLTDKREYFANSDSPLIGDNASDNSSSFVLRANLASSDDIISDIWNSDVIRGHRWSGLTTTNKFYPEDGTGFKQQISVSSGSVSIVDILEEACTRTENVFFVDKQGDAVVQKFSYSDASVATDIAGYIGDAVITDTLSLEDRKGAVLFPDSYQVYFEGYGRRDYRTRASFNTSHVDGYPAASEKDLVTYNNDASQPIYALTQANKLLHQDITDYTTVVDAYGTELSAQSDILFDRYVFGGVIDFEWESQITEIGYTNNPFGVFTYVSIEKRHGVPYYRYDDTVVEPHLPIATATFELQLDKPSQAPNNVLGQDLLEQGQATFFNFQTNDNEFFELKNGSKIGTRKNTDSTFVVNVTGVVRWKGTPTPVEEGGMEIDHAIGTWDKQTIDYDETVAGYAEFENPGRPVSVEWIGTDALSAPAFVGLRWNNINGFNTDLPGVGVNSVRAGDGELNGYDLPGFVVSYMRKKTPDEASNYIYNFSTEKVRGFLHPVNDPLGGGGNKPETKFHLPDFFFEAEDLENWSGAIVPATPGGGGSGTALSEKVGTFNAQYSISGVVDNIYHGLDLRFSVESVADIAVNTLSNLLDNEKLVFQGDITVMAYKPQNPV